MTGVDAAGEMMTGALIAGAVERQEGVRAGHGAVGGLCLNCGTGLLGDHCHRCGQPAHLHRSLSALWHDIAHGVLHFEGKIWNTLPLLVWRPGELTRRFVNGERARFVSPMALFLFSVFLMFATFSAIGAHLEVETEKPPTQVAQDAARAEIPGVRAKIADLRARQAKAPANSPAADALDKQIDGLDGDLDTLKGIAEWKPGRFTDLRTGIPRIDAGLKKANENPNLILYKVQSSAYKFSWALIPLSVPFLWLLYAWKRQFRIYDHAVFVTYSLAFMSMLVIVLTLLHKGGVTEDWIAIAAMTIPVVHIYRQLRGAYGTRRLWAIARTFLLAIFATMTLTTFCLLLLAGGALG